jgi:hypothetical protein
MDVIRDEATAAAVPAAPRAVAAAAERRVEGKERLVKSGTVGGAVRADLDEVFRRNYQLVVGVAARVLGSRDQAEDVAQEAFLSFGCASVPAGEARRWLCAAAAHTALVIWTRPEVPARDRT